MRRVLAIVELGRHGREVARQAREIALGGQARLAIGHIADWEPGVEDFCPCTPRQVEARLAVVIERRLRSLATQIGSADATTLVSFSGLGEMARSWQPDLVVVGRGAEHGLTDRLSVPGWTCEAVVVGVAAAGLLPATARLVTETLWPRRLAARHR